MKKIVVVILLLAGAAWGLYRVYPREQVGINEVSFVDNSGPVTLTGLLLRDSQVGYFYLVQADGTKVKLSISDLETLVGTEVTASGVVTPAPDSTSLPVMQVSEVASK